MQTKNFKITFKTHAVLQIELKTIISHKDCFLQIQQQPAMFELQLMLILYFHYSHIKRKNRSSHGLLVRALA